MAQTFELIRDEKVVIWHRYTVKVEADSLDDAVIKLSGQDIQESWDTQPGLDIGPCQSLYDTEERVKPEPGDLYGSIEIAEADNLEATLWSDAIPAPAPQVKPTYSQLVMFWKRSGEPELIMVRSNRRISLHRVKLYFRKYFNYHPDTDSIHFMDLAFPNESID